MIFKSDFSPIKRTNTPLGYNKDCQITFTNQV